MTSNQPWWLEESSVAQSAHDNDEPEDDSIYSFNDPPTTKGRSTLDHGRADKNSRRRDGIPDNVEISPRRVRSIRIPLDHDNNNNNNKAQTSRSSQQANASNSSDRLSLHSFYQGISERTSKLSKTVSNKWNNVVQKPSESNPRESPPVDWAVSPDAYATQAAPKPRSKSSSPKSATSLPLPTTDTPPPSHPKSLLDTVGKTFSNFSKKVAALSTGASAATSTETEAHNTRKQSSTLTDATQTTPRLERGQAAFRSRSTSSTGSGSSSGNYQRYSIKELIQHLGQDESTTDLPPALERRVRDFKFAQGKRRDRHGDHHAWGIFGLYAHLSDIRADLEWAEDAAWRRQRGEPYLSWTDFEKGRDKGLHNRPWFTYGMIFLCTLMLFVTLGVNGWKVEPLNVNPLIGPSSDTLVQVGARQTDLIVNEGQWFRLFSPLVLHAGLVHYVINMLALYFIGAAVEQSHGFASAAVLFIIPAVGGNILSAICLPQYISVGASGGIFGLIGGCLADISINWNLLFLKSTTDDESRWRHAMVLFWLASDIIINCIIGFTPFVDNFTHLGGFLYGLCCGLSTIERLAIGFFGLQTGKYSKAWDAIVRFSGLIVSVICIMVTTVILVQTDGVTSPCHGCRYISCVPFPPRAEDKWWYCDDCDFVSADLFVDAAGSGLYERIELECPNGEVEEIDISEDGLYDKADVRNALPSYCRHHCDEVFATSN